MQPKHRILKYINFQCDFYYPTLNASEGIFLCISPYEAETLSRSIKLLNECRKIVILQDGVFDFANSFNNTNFKDNFKLLYPSTSNIIFVFGNKEKDYIQYFNPSATVCSYMPTFINNTIERKSTFSNECAEFDVMITTANTAYFSPEEFDILAKYLVKVIKELDLNGFRYCFRIFDRKLLQHLAKHSINLANNIVEVDLVTSLSNVKSVITTPSTLSVEVMILDLPVATLIYRDLPLSVQTGWILSNEKQVLLLMQSMLKYDTERMNIQRALLANYVKSDYPQLNKDDVLTVANGIPSLRDSFDSFAIRQLSSFWNFNIKFFIKRVVCKIIK